MSLLPYHIEKTPKKEEGQHDLNAYGQWLKKLKGEGDLTEEIIKAAGRHDEFEAKAAEKGGSI